jgi:hypothetical protein
MPMWMTTARTPKLPEILQIFDCDQTAMKIEKRVEKGRSMATAQDKTIPIEPIWDEFEKSGPEDMADGSEAERSA